MTLSLSANRWFTNDSKMDQTWWVYDSEERPCIGRCDPGYAIDDDGVWRCNCGTWTIVQEAPQKTMFETMFPELQVYMGQKLWGDIWYDTEEAPRLARMTAADRAAETSAMDARIAVGMVECHLRKVESLYCDRSGKLKQDKLILRRCKWDDTPAANGYKAGCEAHHKGKCPWVHKDQPQLLAQLQAGGKPLPQNGARDFSALVAKPPQKQQQGRW